MYKSLLINRPSRLLLLLLCCTLWVQAGEYTVKTIPNVHLSDRLNYVSNPDGIIEPAGVSIINGLLKTIEDSLGIEVAVVVVESIGIEDARQFATDLFNEWGLGKKNKDNGLLIQLITEPSQRSVVFETGYGLEGVLPDAIAYRLQQRYMLPDMREGNYTSGMVKGVQAVKDYLFASDYERDAMTGNEASNDELWEIAGYIFFMIVFVFFFVFFPVYTQNTKRCPVCKKRKLKRKGSRVMKAATFHSSGLAEDSYICKNCGHSEKRQRYIPRLHSGGGGHFGGGSFGGGRSSGGGSWGGGRSGGGGSISRF